VHAVRDVREVLEYEMFGPDQDTPHGGVEIRFQALGKDAKHPNQYTIPLPFDASGRAALHTYYGFEPLTFLVEFTKGEDGALSATVRLRER
jgi:hypothetical protein